jgi:hypothetical protein
VLLASAYRVEQLATKVATACDTVTLRGPALKRGQREVVTIRLDPQPESDLARAAVGGARTFSVTLQPSAPRVTPAVGVSMLVAPQARFPTYGARTANGGGTEVFAQAPKDARFLWGFSFGTMWRVLSRLDEHPVSLWLPEITISQSNDPKALGLGTALSVGYVKLGGGALWLRHQELVGQQVGQTIPNKDFLQTRDTYRGAKLYLSLTVFGVPPFR